MAKSGKSKVPDTTIVRNKKARHDYFIQDTFEAGMALLGWEVKSLRLKKAQLVDSYVLIKDGEAFLLGCNVTPLNTASTHIVADPSRTKKLLLHKRQLAKIHAATGSIRGTASSMPSDTSLSNATWTATNAPVIAAVRVPPSA